MFHRDAVQPAGEGRPALETAGLPKDGYECLLGGILRILPIPEGLAADAEDPILVPLHEYGEGPPVAGQVSAEQQVVVVRVAAGPSNAQSWNCTSGDARQAEIASGGSSRRGRSSTPRRRLVR